MKFVVLVFVGLINCDLLIITTAIAIFMVRVIIGMSVLTIMKTFNVNVSTDVNVNVNVDAHFVIVFIFIFAYLFISMQF